MLGDRAHWCPAGGTRLVAGRGIAEITVISKLAVADFMEAIEAILASDVSGSAASVYVRFTPNSGSHLGVLKESEISQERTFGLRVAPAVYHP